MCARASSRVTPEAFEPRHSLGSPLGSTRYAAAERARGSHASSAARSAARRAPPPRGAPGLRRRARGARPAPRSPPPARPGPRAGTRVPSRRRLRAPHEGVERRAVLRAGRQRAQRAGDRAGARRGQPERRRVARAARRVVRERRRDQRLRGCAAARQRAARGLHELVLRGARGFGGAEEPRRGPDEGPVRVPERRLAAGEERVARGRVRSAIGVFRVPPENLHPPVRPRRRRRRRQPRVLLPRGGRRRSRRRRRRRRVRVPLRASAAFGEDVVVVRRPGARGGERAARPVPAGSVPIATRVASGSRASNAVGTRARRSAPNSEREGSSRSSRFSK